MSRLSRSFALMFLTAALLWNPVFAADEEEFHCEVLSVTGVVTATGSDGVTRVLQEGDLLSVGETVRSEESSFADLAFDKEWKNVTHVEENSKMKIGSIAPGEVELTRGAVFAKLRALPKDSTFEVQTPTAVATVRGTEYRTTFMGGQTQVFNVSPSKVYVSTVNADGSVDRERELVLEQSKKTQIVKVGQAPEAPQTMSEEEQRTTDVLVQKIEEKIQTAETSGRVSRIQSVEQIATAIAKKASTPQVGPNDSDTSRVVDLRRRPFKKTDP